MDKKILRLLIIDDSPDDADRAATALRKLGYMLKTQRIQDMASMQSALEKGTFDVIISELTLAHFGAPMALDVAKRLECRAPLIVFTRTIQEADVLKLMRAGAVDVVRKDEAFRLVPVIERELRVADERRDRYAMEQKLNELEGKHRAIVEGAREAIGYCQDGMHTDANVTYLEMFGYSKGELEGVPIMNLIDKNDQARFKEFLRKGEKDTQEFLATKKDGGPIHIELRASSITLNSEPCIQVVVSDISKRKAAESRLQYLNQHDPLTGLFNRSYFLQALNTALEEARSKDILSGILYFDLHQIKAINEVLGHAAGDRVLLKVARLFRDKLGDYGVLARFGGDEFAILLKNAPEEQLKSTGQMLATAIKEAAFVEGGKTFTFQGDYGAVVIGKDAPNPQKLLSDVYRAAQPPTPVPAAAPAAPTPTLSVAPTPVAAPTAAPTPPQVPTLTAVVNLSEAAPTQKPLAVAPAPTPVAAAVPAPKPTPLKAEPRRPAVKTAAVDPWTERLQTALDKNGFELFYQPIVNLHGEPAELFEVLVRLPDENGKVIPAAQFMPAAERAGLASVIDRWVVRHALEALRELHSEDRRARFFVNLCPASFREPELIVQTQKQLWEMRIKPKYLSFEADEDALLKEPAEARTFLAAVKKIGCRFTADNFGNHMSNLNQLRDLPIDFLKIAGSHIRNLSEDNLAQASLKALVQIAKSLDKVVIAKSVEKAEDLAILWNLGVDYVQGHYFQEADAQLNYEFGGESTLSSADSQKFTWAQ